MGSTNSSLGQSMLEDVLQRYEGWDVMTDSGRRGYVVSVRFSRNRPCLDIRLYDDQPGTSFPYWPDQVTRVPRVKRG